MQASMRFLLDEQLASFVDAKKWESLLCVVQARLYGHPATCMEGPAKLSAATYRCFNVAI